MILYIAEKPSLARAIADVLPKPHKKHDGYIETANGDCVSWCLGHLLEQVDPDAYDPAFKPWRFEHLPIIPEEWKLKPRSKTRSQLSVLRKLIKQSSQLVHAGDPDREGQLLVDEVINYLKASETKKREARRLLISDLNPQAVKRALASQKMNSEFIPLSVSALARSRADWLYGINMTRAYTIKGRQSGYNGVLSVGRVQTPLLGLVVRRDLEIESFVSKPFYEVVAKLKTQADEPFEARWKPSENCQPWMDEEGRVLSAKLAENVADRITDKPGTVTSLKQTKKRQSAPLPFNLSALQIEAAKRFGMNAKQVLDTCQSLYERHKLITYPRSDCRYLPEEHFAQAADVIGAVGGNAQDLATAADGSNSGLKSAAWNDKKVAAHHAIIPTQRRLGGTRLSADELKVYTLIGQYYLLQFYPAYEYFDTRVEVIIEGGLFTCSAHQTLVTGWKSVLKDGAEKQSHLPPLTEGQQLHCDQGIVEQKQTQPPKHFTDATLLSAMTGIARYVTDPDIRKILKETDGLGTEATRAGIIELLFTRGFLYREGKSIRASEVGKALISCLPDSATTPDMTAQWESTLDDISLKKSNYDGFIQPLQVRLKELVSASETVQIPASLKSAAPAAKKPGRRRRSNTGNSTKRKSASRSTTSKRSSGGSGKKRTASSR